jgi:hypothetical protein
MLDTALSYNLAVAFWQSSLPTLARNTPTAREANRARHDGEISDAESKRGARAAAEQSQQLRLW